MVEVDALGLAAISLATAWNALCKLLVLLARACVSPGLLPKLEPRMGIDGADSQRLLRSLAPSSRQSADRSPRAKNRQPIAADSPTAQSGADRAPRLLEEVSLARQFRGPSDLRQLSAFAPMLVPKLPELSGCPAKIEDGNPRLLIGQELNSICKPGFGNVNVCRSNWRTTGGCRLADAFAASRAVDKRA